MASVKDRVFVGGGHPSSDVNPWLDALATSVADQVDGLAPEVYASLTAAKTPYKPFIVGFIPPDVQVNFVPFEQDKTLLATVAGKSVNTQSTVPGQSAAGGKNVYGMPSSPTELPKTETVFSQRALGSSIYDNLKKRGFSEEDARRLTPLLVGQANAEIRKNARGDFVTYCYNIGNVHSRGPGQGGYYYVGQDRYGSSDDAVKRGLAKVDDKYTTYFVAAPTLDEGVDRWIGATLGWKEVRNATNGYEFAKALRPDLFPESRGGNPGAYFTAGSSPDDPAFLAYARNVQAGADVFRARNPDFASPDPGGVLAGSGNEVPPAVLPSGSAPAHRASIMTSGEVTTYEEDDPIGGRTGRNIRPVNDERAAVVNRQVEDLRRQVEAVRATPSLYLLVSPQNFHRSYEQAVDAPKGRRRHIVHSWGEKPMTITCKGVTAAQYVIDGQGAGGLTHQKRVHSLSYRNLMSLVRIYKNNGWLFTKESSGKGNEGIRQIAMSVFIYFDGHVYIGSFDDFTITDSADKPYNLEYSFRFTVRYDVEAVTATDAQLARSIGGR